MNTFRFLKIGLLFWAVSALAAEPVNLTKLKYQLIQYHDSGEYSRAISTAITEAMYYLKFRINQNAHLKRPHQLAMVLAVDETMLSNYPDMVHLSFGGTLEETNALEDEGHDPAILHTLTLYNYAKKHGIAVFLVTHRQQYERAAMINNLMTVGYHDWNGLYMQPDNYHDKSIASFKIKDRKKIIAMGYDIILNIGAQKSDIEGGYADMVFKLPNPFYLISYLLNRGRTSRNSL